MSLFSTLLADGGYASYSLGSLTNNGRKKWRDNLTDSVEQLNIYRADNRMDCNNYLSVSTFKNGKTRSEWNVKEVKRLYVDMDAHENPINLDEAKLLRDYILENWLDGEDLPEPNYIIFSGRGLQFLFTLTGCNNVPEWQRYQSALLNACQKLLEELKHHSISEASIVADEHNVSIDMLKDAARVMRVPDTKNQKVNVDTELLYENEANEYTLNELNTTFTAFSDDNLPTIEEKKTKKKTKSDKEKKKKEKPEKEDKPSVSEKKLSPKKILPIVVVCISLGAVILLLGNFLADYTAKRSGREAYYAGDYQTCYQNLMGKELDETEQVMYSQSESILTIRMWLREYEVFVNEGSELEALDSLLQAVRDYPTLLNYATQWNAQDEVSLAFQDILNILSQKYQLSQEEAQQIADISDNVEYTKNVMLVLQRLGLGFWEFPQGTVTEETSAPNTEEAPAQLPDPLPEEKEIQQ